MFRHRPRHHCRAPLAQCRNQAECMMRFATLLTCTLLTIVCGCAVSPPDNTLSYRPGEAVVEAVRPARVELPRRESGAIAGSEAAGGSYGSPIERLFRPRWIEGY